MLNIAPSHHIACDCAPALGRGRQSRRCRTLHKDPKAISFDYLVGGGQQCRWYREAERLGGFQINTIFERELCTASQPLISQLGQTEKNSVRANVFRVTPESRHCSIQSACRKRATAHKETRAPQQTVYEPLGTWPVSVCRLD